MVFRQTLSETLIELMRHDDKIVILDADLAKANGTSSIYKEFPDRCYDIGVSEANMISMAAGLSSMGFKPIVVSFTPFVTRRVCDQIAISCLYAKQNVKIIGTDPGIWAEVNGGTHMSMEDVGVLRSIPGIKIFDVADSVQLQKALPDIMNYYGTMYIRIPRKVDLEVFDSNYKFNMFKADVVKEGKDATLIVSGTLIKEALEARELLKEKNIDIEVISNNFIKPLDEETLLSSIKKTKHVFTLENHNIIGGLFSAVSEMVVRNYPINVVPIGINDEFGQVGSYKELSLYYHLTSLDIMNIIIKYLK